MTDNIAVPRDDGKPTPKPSDEDVERAKERMAEIDALYEPGARKTVVMAGSHGMVSGTAFDGVVENDEEWAGSKKSETRDR